MEVRIMRRCVFLSLVTGLLSSLVALDVRAAYEPDPEGNRKSTATPSRKDRLRYAGKSFAEWRELFLTEIEPNRRMSCLKSFESFSMHGYGAEVTAVFLEMMAEYDDAFAVELSGYDDGDTSHLKLFKSEDVDDGKVTAEFKKIVHRLGPTAVPVLRKALTGKSSAARWMAIEELAAIGSLANAAIPELIDLTQHESMPVRFGAVVALGKVAEGDQRALKPLLRVLRDKEAKLRVAALTAIEELGSAFAKPAAAAIVKSLDDNEPSVRQKALQAVAKAAVALKAVPAVIRILQMPDVPQNTRQHAYALLQEAGPHAKSAVPALLAILKDLTEDGKKKEPEPAKSNVRPPFPSIIGEEASETAYDEVAKIAQTLAAIGPDAMAAVPLLQRIVNTNPWRQETIRSALKKIEVKS
jgi:HEAT repeat protein